MNRSRPTHPARQLIHFARELSELGRRAVELGQALEALAGVDPVSERERLQQGTGGSALAQIQVRVDEMLARAEAATRCAVGPTQRPPQLQARIRLSRSIV